MSNFFKDLKLVGKATQTIEALKQQCEEITEENELLLLQLHQLQEELEHYFLKCQDIKQDSEKNRQRLDRVLADNQTYFSYDQIQFEPVQDQTDRLHWTISGLFGARKYRESCKFDTIVEKGIVGFLFSKNVEGGSHLTVWPKTYENQQEILCIPTGTAVNVQKRAELLKTLSTSDWSLVTLLPEVLSKAIEQGHAAVPHDKQLINALKKTHDILLKHIPSKLRFDTVKLTKILVHPGYEHLAFSLSNFSHAGRNHPEFEFRMGCSNVMENKFGTDPKLEFPLINGKPPFESWFAESEDEFGPKLEIRFALPDAMDIEVWNKLKPVDQKLISDIISRLKEFIESVYSEFEQMDRPAQDWIEIAQNLKRIFKQHGTVKNDQD